MMWLKMKKTLGHFLTRFLSGRKYIAQNLRHNFYITIARSTYKKTDSL